MVDAEHSPSTNLVGAAAVAAPGIAPAPVTTVGAAEERNKTARKKTEDQKRREQEEQQRRQEEQQRRQANGGGLAPGGGRPSFSITGRGRGRAHGRAEDPPCAGGEEAEAEGECTARQRPRTAPVCAVCGGSHRKNSTVCPQRTAGQKTTRAAEGAEAEGEEGEGVAQPMARLLPQCSACRGIGHTRASKTCPHYQQRRV